MADIGNVVGKVVEAMLPAPVKLLGGLLSNPGARPTATSAVQGPLGALMKLAKEAVSGIAGSLTGKEPLDIIKALDQSTAGIKQRGVELTQAAKDKLIAEQLVKTSGMKIGEATEAVKKYRQNPNATAADFNESMSDWASAAGNKVSGTFNWLRNAVAGGAAAGVGAVGTGVNGIIAATGLDPRDRAGQLYASRIDNVVKRSADKEPLDVLKKMDRDIPVSRTGSRTSVSTESKDKLLAAGLAQFTGMKMEDAHAAVKTYRENPKIKPDEFNTVIGGLKQKSSAPAAPEKNVAIDSKVPSGEKWYQKLGESPLPNGAADFLEKNFKNKKPTADELIKMIDDLEKVDNKKAREKARELDSLVQKMINHPGLVDLSGVKQEVRRGAPAPIVDHSTSASPEDIARLKGAELTGRLAEEAGKAQEAFKGAAEGVTKEAKGFWKKLEDSLNIKDKPSVPTSAPSRDIYTPG